MKFFVPSTETEEQAAHLYAGIRKFLTEQLSAHFADRKVQSLRWRHDGKECFAEVGKLFEREPVIAILYEPGRNLYHVCTPERGVIRGMSILAGGASVLDVTDFTEE